MKERKKHQMIKNKKGQLVIFVIVILFIVGGVIFYLSFRQERQEEKIQQNFEQVFDYYQRCIEREAKNAITILGEQGGRIDEGTYLPGSDFSPFSSYLNFFGIPVKYWYHVSGNSIIRENVPTINEMEKDIERYIEENLAYCDMEELYKNGFEIDIGAPKASVDIKNRQVVVKVNVVMNVKKEDQIARRNDFQVNVNSKLGKFYSIAAKIYNKEKKDAFLEQYAVDVLYNYAPVDGVEIQCAPKIWRTKEVFDGIMEGLEQNIRTIKFKSDYYTLKNKNRDYFVVDENVDESVNVMYLRDWPIEISVDGEGVDDEIMFVEPIGTQEGLGVMGFCYVPYHFVYDIKFPVLIQIYDGREIFQFPVIVVVDNNMPRRALPGAEARGKVEFDLCEYKTQPIEVNLLDINLKRVNGNLSFECFDQRCNLGETINGKFVGVVPACYNGFIVVRSEGYAEKIERFSSNKDRTANIVLYKEHEVKISLSVNGREYNERAIVLFERDDGKISSAVFPEVNKVKLTEGNYEVKVYVYSNASLTLPATRNYRCVNVPREGLLGLFGGTKEQCFDITVPETKIDTILIGGGKAKEYILDSTLKKGKIKIDVNKFPIPRTLEQLAKNFELFETGKVRLSYG